MSASRAVEVSRPGRGLRAWAVIAGRSLAGPASIGLVLLVWWAVASSHATTRIALPTIGQTFAAARHLTDDGQLGAAVRVTTERVLVAFALGVILGSVVGMTVGRVRPVREALQPLIRLAFPIPKIALYPVLLAIFGLGAESKIALGFTESFFPVALSAAAGASQISPTLVWVSRSMGTSRLRRGWALIAPASLPMILTGARIALIGSLIGVFLGEMIAGSDGLGQLATQSYTTIDTPGLYVALITISLIGLVLDQALLFARRRLLRWAASGA